MMSRGEAYRGVPETAAELSFGDLKVGLSREFEVTVCADLVHRFADLTADRNPLHISPEYAKTTTFGRPIVHGMLLNAFFSTIVGMMLPGRRALYLSQSSKFIKPVHWGDKVHVLGKIIRLSPSSRIVELKTTVSLANGDVAVAGEATVMVLEDASPKTLEPAEVNLDFTDKIVLITGGSRGIGAAAALTFAKLGAVVAVNYRTNRQAAEQVVGRAAEFPGKAVAMQADVSNGEQVAEMVATIERTLGRVGILVHNATGPLNPRPFLSLSVDEFAENLNVGLMGVVHCARAVIPGMVDMRYGRIISVLSAGVLGKPEVANAAYVATKSALEGLSKSLAVEFGPNGIQVNMVAPGYTDTELVRQLPVRARDVYAHQTPLRRVASPQDIARAIVYLASDMADYVSGVTVPVCGGHYMS